MKNISFIFYCAILILLTIFSYAFIDPNLFYLKEIYTGFAFQQKVLTTIMYIFFLLILFGFYFFLIYLSKKKNNSTKNLKIWLITTIIISFFAYPAILSYDIFNYIAAAKIVFYYHENPYLIMPIAFKGEPLLAFMHTANNIDVYGFIWTLITGVPFILGFGNFLTTLFAFKLLIVAFYLFSLYGIKKISNDNLTVALFAFNPLVIMESLISGHNDIAMMALALFSFYMLSKKKILLSIILLILSIFIKYVTIVLIPVFVYVIIKQRTESKLDWDKIYVWSTGLMFFIFLLTIFRSEIYPWYAQWFLIFAVLVRKKWIKVFAIVLSFSLLLRDIPYMLLGTYFGPTPFIKTFVTVSPPLMVFIYICLKKAYLKVMVRSK